MSETQGSGESTTETGTEWVVRWNEGGIVPYGARDEAVNVARVYGYGTPESKVSVQHRTVTVTYGPWIAAEDGDDEDPR